MMKLLLLFLFGVLYSSHAHNHVFNVGENDGWTLKPSENYSHWAQRKRFHINDQLVFKYKKGEDSVLVVREDDYKKCNKRNPIQTLIYDVNGNYSKFKFHRSGPFFFISGHDLNCEKGQKFITVVMADHHRHQPPSSAPSPSPSPAAKPPSHSPSPTLHPPSHSPSPAYKPSSPPSHSPSPSPTATPCHAPPVHPPSHAPSPSPTSKTPTHAPPTHSPSPSPSATKPPTHAPPSHSPSPSPSPATKTPTHAPPSSPPSSPPSPPPAQSAPQPDPDSQEYPPVSLPPHLAPAPSPSSASAFGGSFILTVVLGVAATVIPAWVNV